MNKILAIGFAAATVLALSGCATGSSLPAQGVQFAGAESTVLSDASGAGYFQHDSSSLRQLDCPRPAEDTSADAARCARVEMRRRLAPNFAITP